MAMPQIISAVMALLIAGGMLIPGNIPNIVAAGRLKINMKEWAVIGVPIGLALMIIYFVVLIPLLF
jgi:predicted cation transporter